MRDALTDSVRAHLVSDVPVSVFLSAESILRYSPRSRASSGLRGRNHCRVRGVRRRTGRRGARGCRHRGALRAAASRTPRIRSEFARDAPRILAAMDQPSIDGINTWFASKAAAERGHKVVLSGVGGDELFCGYSSFTRMPRAAVLPRGTASGSTRALLDGSSRISAGG